jgi:hypothetical protein
MLTTGCGPSGGQNSVVDPIEIRVRRNDVAVNAHATREAGGPHDGPSIQSSDRYTDQSSGYESRPAGPEKSQRTGQIASLEATPTIEELVSS